MTISLRLNDDDTMLFKKYAELNGITVSELVRRAVIERIEDEYDLSVFAQYEKEKENGTLETYPINELWKELGL